MTDILTITFSPCIDKSTLVPELVPEKKLRCAEPKLEPGGGGINVARAIKKLGGNATALYLAGGYTGKYFNALVQKENIHAIVVETENETRENLIIVDQSANKQYRFGMPGTNVQEKEWKKLLEEVEHYPGPEFIIVSGSLPPGVPADIIARIARIAKKKESKIIVDTSGEALQYALEEGVFLLKPNIGELASLTGHRHIEPYEISQLARDLIHKAESEVLVVSLGADGAMLVTSDQIHKYKPPAVERKSTVGAGDSMVAGIVWSLSRGNDIAAAVRYGVACGTAATLNPGTELCKPEDADELFNHISMSESDPYAKQLNLNL
jgi:6-phosphofructokinase 2